jgi:trans-aconitate methyltransferase
VRASARQEDVRRYFDRAAPEYAGASARWPWAWLRRREARAVFDLLGDVRGRTVLELGCGAGHYTRLLLAAGASRVVAVDLSPAMLSAAPTERTIRVRADAARVALRAPAGAVLAAGLLEFVDDPAAVLANARRNAAAGTPLVLLVPGGGLPARGYRAWHRRHAVAARLYDRGSLEALATGEGWRVETTRAVWPFTLVARLAAVGA